MSLLLGIAVDVLRGVAMTAASLYATGKALVSMTTVVAMTTAAGALFGVLARAQAPGR